jgi:hypothetical protein
MAKMYQNDSENLVWMKVQWNRIGFNNQRVASGLYFVRVKLNQEIVVKKILLE